MYWFGHEISMILFNFSLKPKYVRIVLHECIADSSSSLVFSISSPWLRAKQNRTGLAFDLHFHVFLLSDSTYSKQYKDRPRKSHILGFLWLEATTFLA